MNYEKIEWFQHFQVKKQMFWPFHSVEQWKIYSHGKFFSSNQLFSNYVGRLKSLLSRNFSQKRVRLDEMFTKYP